MTGSSIIKKFELYVDDGTELSAQDELDLLNKVYKDVWTDRPWLFASKEFSGTISGTSIALPSDFANILVNTSDNTPKAVVYIGNNYYKVVNFANRKQYSGDSSVCWVDIVNDVLQFNVSLSGTVEYDYNSFPDTLTLFSSPAFPESYHAILYHLMAVDDYAIQQFDKARSYAKENQDKADYWLDKMRIWDANLKINSYDE